VSNVASKASVHHQPPLPGSRPRMPGQQSANTASPFAMLLDTGDAPPTPNPQRPERPQASANARASSAGDPPRERPAAATRETSETEPQPQAKATEPGAETEEAKAAKAKTTLDPFAIAAPAEGEVKKEVTAAVDLSLLTGEAKTQETATVDLSLLTAAVTDPMAITPKEQPVAAVAALVTAPVEIQAAPVANAEAAPVAVESGAVKAVAPGAQAADAALLKAQAGEAKKSNDADPAAQKTANPAPIAAGTEVSANAGAKAGEAQGAKETNAAPKAEGKPDNASGRPQEAAQKSGEPSPARSEFHARDTADLARPGPDGAQLSALHATTERFGNLAAQAAQPAGATAASATAVPITGLAVEIAAHAQAGRNRFEIRLDPPELGRIDVRLDVDRSGQVTSRLVVEKAETLDLLRRDSAELERALQQAGLKTADNSMQFTLRDQSFAGRDDGSASGSAATLIVPDSELGGVDILAASYGRVLRPGGGIDIRV
jgi:flagellar hook-length control protein FliK